MDINVRAQTSRGTPLYGAAVKSQWSALECLVGWGAALNVVDKDGCTPLYVVTNQKSSVIPESPQLIQVSVYYCNIY